MKTDKISLLVMALLTISCSWQKAVNEFPCTELPASVAQNIESATEYMTNHFWDRYVDMAKRDTSLFSLGEQEMKRAFVNWIMVLTQNKEMAKAADAERKLVAVADSLALQGSKKFLATLIKYSELYLYNPNSPYLNEELYIPILEGIMASKSLDSLSKVAYKYQLELSLLNRVGQRANDFIYTYLTKGSSIQYESSLYNTDGEYLLLYFNNPGCLSCNQIKEILEKDENIRSLIESKRLTILSVYIDGDDFQWREGYKKSPDEWIYAKGDFITFSDNTLYGIRAIPSLYLLDSSKTVLLKDASIGRAVEFLSGLR